jgi:probable addiction module antidote protein
MGAAFATTVMACVNIAYIALFVKPEFQPRTRRNWHLASSKTRYHHDWIRSLATSTKTLPFDPAEHLTDPADQVDLLTDALVTGNAAYIANALGTIARARGMSAVARGAGVTRETLYKSLTEKGDPKLTTFMSVLKTMNIQLTARAEPTGHARKASRARRSRPPRASRAA